jgi:hypothetical protein
MQTAPIISDPSLSAPTISAPPTSQILEDVLEAVRVIDYNAEKEAMKAYCFICWEKGHKRGKCASTKNTEDFKIQKAVRLQALKLNFPLYFKQEADNKQTKRRPAELYDMRPQIPNNSKPSPSKPPPHPRSPLFPAVI